jgi:hypothetical protein
MPRGLVKLRDRYFEWSTVVDAPVTRAGDYHDMLKFSLGKYGRKDLDRRDYADGEGPAAGSRVARAPPPSATGDGHRRRVSRG